MGVPGPSSEGGGVEQGTAGLLGRAEGVLLLLLLEVAHGTDTLDFFSGGSRPAAQAAVESGTVATTLQHSAPLLCEAATGEAAAVAIGDATLGRACMLRPTRMLEAGVDGRLQMAGLLLPNRFLVPHAGVAGGTAG